MKINMMFLALIVSMTASARTVKVSDFGFDALDSTRFIQQALDSKADKVIIDRQRTDWVSGPLSLTNANQEVVLAAGVTVRAKRGAFHGLCDRFFFIYKTSNVTLRGETGATIVMNKMDYLDKSQYKHSEWRHAVQILSAPNTVVRDLTILSSGGDGVETHGSKNVLIENVVCHNHHRQGISVTDADGLTVRNCVFNGTHGTSPQCGVDLEPYRAEHRLKDVLFENCTFNGNWASGIDLHLACLTDKSEPISIVFRNCTAIGNRRYGITVYTGYGKRSVRGNLLFENITTAENGDYAVRLVNNMPGGVDIRFKDCDFDARGSSPLYGMIFDNGQMQQDFAGVTFENCRLTLDAEKKVCTFAGMTGAGIRNVAGVLDVKRGDRNVACDLAAFVAKHPPHPELMHDFSANSVDFRELVPTGGKLANPITTPWIWMQSTFMQHVPGPGKYDITFDTYTYRKEAKRPTVLVRDRWGTDLGSFTLDNDHQVYTIDAKGENLYRFELSVGGNHRVKITSGLAGQGLLCEDYLVLYGHGGGGEHDAYFIVPAKAKLVMVEIVSGEPVDAQLMDASGTVVAEYQKGRGRDIYTLPHSPSSKDEIWHLAFKRVQENCKYRIGGDALSIVSMAAEATLREKLE